MGDKIMKIVMDFRKYDGVVGVEQAVIQITKYIAMKWHQVIMLCKRNRFADHGAKNFGDEIILLLRIAEGCEYKEGYYYVSRHSIYIHAIHKRRLNRNGRA